MKQEQTVDELNKLLSKQLLPKQDMLDLLGKYVHEKQSQNYDECLLLISMFMYGYICGKRAERERRSKAPKKNGV